MIIIIGILAAIAIPMFLNQRNKAKDAGVKEGVHSIQVGIQSWAVDNIDPYPVTGRCDTAGRLAGNPWAAMSTWPINPVGDHRQALPQVVDVQRRLHLTGRSWSPGIISRCPERRRSRRGHYASALERRAVYAAPPFLGSTELARIGRLSQRID